jgi:GNAT superfamily N-acetyltransferase
MIHMKPEHAEIVQRDIPVTMVRKDLENIPDYALAPGYSLRAYQPGDEELWRQIHLLADRYNAFQPDLFFQEFGHDRELLEERQLYLCDVNGNAVGTATAWFNNDYKGQVCGWVHWVAIVPQEQGKGSSKALMTGVCNLLRELGHSRAYLITSTARIPAINLYLRFGFVPEINYDYDARIWCELEKVLREPVDFGPGETKNMRTASTNSWPASESEHRHDER